MVETLVFLLEMLSLELNWKRYRPFPENPSALEMTRPAGLPQINNYGFQLGVYRATSKEREGNPRVTCLPFYFYFWNFEILCIDSSSRKQGMRKGLGMGEHCSQDNRGGEQKKRCQQIRRRLFKKMSLSS